MVNFIKLTLKAIKINEMFSHEKGAVAAQTGKVVEEDEGAQNLLKVGAKKE